MASCVAQARELQLQANALTYPLERALAVLHDPEGSFSIDAILDQPDRFVFKPLSGAFNVGRTRDVYWVTFSFRRASGAPPQWWLHLEPGRIDSIDVFIVEPEGRNVIHKRGGTALPFFAPDVVYRSNVFRLDFPDERPRRVYVRLQKLFGPLFLQGGISEPASFAAAAAKESWIFGMYFGIWSAVLVGFVLLWRLEPNRLAWYWMCYVAAEGWYIFAVIFLGAVVGYWATPWKDILVVVAPFFVVLTAVSFYRELFGIRRHAAGAQWFAWHAFKVIELSCWFVIGYSVWIDRFSLSAKATTPLSLALILLIAGLFAQRIRHGFEEIKWYFYGFAVFMLLLLVAAAWHAGIIPTLPGQTYIWFVTLLSNMLLCGVGIVRRYSLTQQERQQARQLAVRAQAELASAQAQRRFVTLVSHEFRAPLAIIEMSMHNLMRLGLQLPSEVGARLEKITRAHRRLWYLIENYLTEERMNGAYLEPHMAETDLHAVLDEVVAQANALATSHRIAAVLPAAKLSVVADRHLLRLALGNLMDNVIKYSPAGGEIVLSAQRAGRQVHIELRDGGEGIAAEDLPRVFDKYFRASRGTANGTGLGLFLVKCIVELHGGHIAAESVENAGTTMTIRLPADAAGMDADVIHAPH